MAFGVFRLVNQRTSVIIGVYHDQEQIWEHQEVNRLQDWHLCSGGVALEELRDQKYHPEGPYTLPLCTLELGLKTTSACWLWGSNHN